MQKFFTIYRLATLFPRCPRANPFPGNLPLLICLILGNHQFCCAQESSQPLKESQFEQAISRPLNANADRTTLRHYLRRLSQVQQVAILLDRRVDPSQQVDVAISADYFDDGIRKFVQQAACEISIVADTIFVGQPDAALSLRTRIELARDEMDGVKQLTPKRQFELLRRYQLDWDEVTSPQEMITRHADRYKVRITNPEAIPHDLWTSGTIANPNFIEGCLMILTQFGLAFEWVTAHEIRIVPQIPDVGINQGHHPKGMNLEEALALTKQQFPQLEVRQYRNTILFTGTVEDHEAVAILIGEKPSLRKRTPTASNDSLDDVRFTFKMVEKPFGSLMATLQVQGIEVHYDKQEIEAAKIDLGKPISLELNEATIHQLLEKSCTKVGLSYQIENGTVRLVVPKN